MSVNTGYVHELENVNTGKDYDLYNNYRRNSNCESMTPTTCNEPSQDGWIAKIGKSQCGCNNNIIIKVVGSLIILMLVWTLLYCLLGDEVLITGDLLKILLLVIISYTVGQLITIIRLPPLLGMLITGIAFRTSGFYSVSGVYTDIVIVFRELSLSVILIKAGLGLDAATLVKLSLVVLRLALLPCFCETAATAVGAYFVFGFPWSWGLLLGFLMSAVSPAIVVPSLLSLKERGYGENKGIATLVIAASNVDDIACISGFGIFLGMIFSKGDSIGSYILQGPIELLIGLSSGTMWGLISAIFPNKCDDLLTVKRAIMIGTWGLLVIIGSEKVGCSGAGPLSCITAPLVANIFWKLQGWSSDYVS